MFYTLLVQYPIKYNPKGSRLSIPCFEEGTAIRETAVLWVAEKKQNCVFKSLQQSTGKTCCKNGPYLKEKG